MILYGSSLSPFVRKVLVYGAEKGLSFDLRPGGLINPTAEFLEASPAKKMPALRDGDYLLADSSAIIHYLESKHPQPPLIPADARLRGKTIWFEEYADTVLFACGAKIFFNRIVAPRFLGRPGDEGAAVAAERDDLPPLLDYLETVAPDDGDYLVGEGLTLADIAIAGPFANLRHCGIAIDEGRYPRIAKFVERILARPSFTQWVERETAMLERESA